MAVDMIAMLLYWFVSIYGVFILIRSKTKGNLCFEYGYVVNVPTIIGGIVGAFIYIYICTYIPDAKTIGEIFMCSKIPFDFGTMYLYTKSYKADASWIFSKVIINALWLSLVFIEFL